MKFLYLYAIACAVLALTPQDRRAEPLEPKLRIISPTSMERLTGDVVFSAEVEGSVAKGLQFFVDGALVCYPTAAPFEHVLAHLAGQAKRGREIHLEQQVPVPGYSTPGESYGQDLATVKADGAWWAACS